MYKLLDTVALTHNIPNVGLRRGDLGAVVEIHTLGAMEVEFVGSGPGVRSPISQKLSQSDSQLHCEIGVKFH